MHCGTCRAQPSAAEVLVLIPDWSRLISDWSGLQSDDVMLVTIPNKEVSVENQGSAKAGNLFMVIGDCDVELGTKKRHSPLH